MGPDPSWLGALRGEEIRAQTHAEGRPRGHRGEERGLRKTGPADTLVLACSLQDCEEWGRPSLQPPGLWDS